ncbi:hypothetical protein H2248_002156 [Termitomyces sp. 'cryptogamus']|nr:hypothetical protein H2248_002156 [Termitomyces sp. 'cryptogamus']
MHAMKASSRFGIPFDATEACNCNLPYYANKIVSCPDTLERPNFEGLFTLTLMTLPNQGISRPQAQMMVFVLDKVDKYCDWEDQEISDVYEPQKKGKGKGRCR